MQTATIGMFDEVDRQLTQLASAAAASPVEPLPTMAAPPRTPAPEVTWLPPPPPDPGRLQTGIAVATATVAVLGLALIAAANILHLFDARGPLTGRAAVDSVVSRIVAAESRGLVDAKNKHSSASGPAQFLDDTWLEMIRAYRPDLTKYRTRAQLLALRAKPQLAHDIAVRFAERNAALLHRRGLPVTAGTLYLAHFAGAAGAAALLTAPPHADAAGVMAMADASGRTSREKIVKANPFLDEFTVTDIRRWADRKMQGPALVLTALLSADARR